MRPPPQTLTRLRGMSYPEVLAAVLLIAVLLVPAIDALRSSATGAGIRKQLLEEQYALRSKTEAVLSRPFGELEINESGENTASALSDTFVLEDGSTISRNVYIAAHDIDNADADNNPRTGTDSGVLWVRVAIANSRHSIETLVTQ